MYFSRKGAKKRKDAKAARRDYEPLCVFAFLCAFYVIELTLRAPRQN